jgi:hypothetical protein
MMMVYKDESILFKGGEEGIEEIRRIKREIMSIMFFEELLFYCTENEIYMDVLGMENGLEL